MSTDEVSGFVDEELCDASIICLICQKKIQDPYLTLCEHMFCKACITENTPAQCPTCQQPVISRDLTPAPLIIRNIIERSRVTCLGCDQHNIPKENFNDHLQRVCPKAIGPCPAANIKCPWTGPRETITHHLLTCPFHSVSSIFLQLKSENQRLMDQLQRLQTSHNVQYQSHIQSIESIRDNQAIQMDDFADKVSRIDIETQQGSIDCMCYKTSITQLEQQIAVLQNELSTTGAELRRVNELVIQNEKRLTNLIKMQNIMTKLIADSNPDLIRRITESDNCSIDLSNNNLTDRDLFIVVQHAIINKQCQSLNLQSNKITAQGVGILAEALETNTTLKTLLLHDNSLSDLGVFHLAEGLTNNSTLTILELESNSITDNGVASLAKLLRNNSTLTHLYLSNNKISDVGVELLCDALASKQNSLKELILDYNQLVTDASVTPLICMLEQNQTLSTLRLWNCQLTEQAKAKFQNVLKSKRDFTLLC